MGDNLVRKFHQSVTHRCCLRDDLVCQPHKSVTHRCRLVPSHGTSEQPSPALQYYFLAATRSDELRPSNSHEGFLAIWALEAKIPIDKFRMGDISGSCVQDTQGTGFEHHFFAAPAICCSGCFLFLSQRWRKLYLLCALCEWGLGRLQLAFVVTLIVALPVSECLWVTSVRSVHGLLSLSNEA